MSTSIPKGNRKKKKIGTGFGEQSGVNRVLSSNQSMKILAICKFYPVHRPYPCHVHE